MQMFMFYALHVKNIKHQQEFPGISGNPWEFLGIPGNIREFLGISGNPEESWGFSGILGDSWGFLGWYVLVKLLSKEHHHTRPPWATTPLGM